MQKLAQSLLFSITATLVLSPLTFAQDEENSFLPNFSAGKKPFVYAMAASANRLKDEASYIFEAAGAPDALDDVMDVLNSNVNGLSGINWDRPAGMMLYLNSVFPPSFEAVSFLPISTIEEFQQMMELGTVVMRQVPNEDGRYELITPRRNIQIRVEGEYAFIQMPWTEPDPTFDRELPSPAQLVSSLSNQFDLGITLDVEAVPKATRDLMLNTLTAMTSTQMQQRDEEADSTYDLRKSWMQADMDALKLVFDEMRTMSFGVNVDSDQRVANIDMVMNVKEGGQLLEEILASSGKASYFSPILNDEAPVSLSWSGIMADRDIERYTNVLEALKGEAARVVEENEELGAVPGEGSPVFLALDALKATFAEGELDVFGQFYNDSDDKLAVVGAIRVEDGEQIATGLQDILNRIPDEAKSKIGELLIGHNQHEGVTFHRLNFKDVDAGGREIFGKNAGLSIGCGQRSLWICVGGENSFDTLTSTMDSLVEAYENPTGRKNTSAMRLLVQVNELIEIFGEADKANKAERAEKAAAADAEKAVAGRDQGKSKSGGESRFGGGDEREKRVQQFRQRRQERNELMVEALAEGDDRIEMTVRPTDNGMRMRAIFEEGFIRGIGRSIASRFSEGN